MTCLRSAGPIVDETWMIGIRQNAVKAIGRKAGHLQWETSPTSSPLTSLDTRRESHSWLRRRRGARGGAKPRSPQSAGRPTYTTWVELRSLFKYTSGVEKPVVGARRCSVVSKSGRLAESALLLVPLGGARRLRRRAGTIDGVHGHPACLPAHAGLVLWSRCTSQSASVEATHVGLTR